MMKTEIIADNDGNDLFILKFKVLSKNLSIANFIHYSWYVVKREVLGT